MYDYLPKIIIKITKASIEIWLP